MTKIEIKIPKIKNKWKIVAIISIVSLIIICAWKVVYPEFIKYEGNLKLNGWMNGIRNLKEAIENRGAQRIELDGSILICYLE